jgi:hypothetical protein
MTVSLALIRLAFMMMHHSFNGNDSLSLSLLLLVVVIDYLGSRSSEDCPSSLKLA